VVPELCDAVALGGQRGILLTAETAAGLCLANRRRGVRAALANDFATVEAALQSVATNVLVIDPVRVGNFRLQRMAERLSRADLNVNDGFARFLK
jgi:ribose 5-phosphate isomerase RpiB